MPHQKKLKDPWLIAAWPGMGHVAVGAVAYLIDQLGATITEELPADAYFRPHHVDVDQGIASPARLPRNLLFECSGTDWEHDLLIFLGEAQPESDGVTLCNHILDRAGQRGVTRVMTFAALATQLHPAAQPQVFAAATKQNILDELTEHGTGILGSGQIGGLNGLMLAACAQRDLPAGCLLGELPFFASGIKNPKASKAVLQVFADLCGCSIDYSAIDQECAEIDPILHEVLEKLKNDHDPEPQDQGDEIFNPAFTAEMGHTAQQSGQSDDAPHSRLTQADRRRIEELFDQAMKSKEEAFKLKQELDRLEVFDQYQDRFLDLFKRAD